MDIPNEKIENLNSFQMLENFHATRYQKKEEQEEIVEVEKDHKFIFILPSELWNWVVGYSEVNRLHKAQVMRDALELLRSSKKEQRLIGRVISEVREGLGYDEFN